MGNNNVLDADRHGCGKETGNMEENTNLGRKATIHQVGTVTLGISLVVFGFLFLLRTWLPVITYELIFHLWPIIFIFLGFEVLFSTESKKFIFSKGSIFLLICMTLFAMGMGVADICIQAGMQYLTL